MHIKEYRIPIPLTVEEYRIAQLYMIQKKSRDESSGQGSGVEIIKNEPYINGPGGNGQYTFKIYHIGSHIPSWFRSILPKSALKVEEEAWNAYPYTKTIFRCPFIEKFSITIETVYHQDGATQNNVFNLSPADLSRRGVDLLDFVNDYVPPSDYKKEEDPKLYKSVKTGRGPLSDDWLDDRIANPTSPTEPVMCAYKLCAVEFRYWGMQTKIEKFIHDIALRKTMVRAHRQAWAWQDEWASLSINDIRSLEVETQKALAMKMVDDLTEIEQSCSGKVVKNGVINDEASNIPIENEENAVSVINDNAQANIMRTSVAKSSATAIPASWTSFEQTNDDSDDEFFDAKEAFEDQTLTSSPGHGMVRTSSMEVLLDDYMDSPTVHSASGLLEGNFKKMHFVKDMEEKDSKSKIAVLFIVLHGGSSLLVESDKNVKLSELATFKATFEKVVNVHYPSFTHKYAIKLVSCPPIHKEALSLLTSISPYSSESSDNGGQLYHECLPISCVPLLATKSADYDDMLNVVCSRVNKLYQEFMLSDEGINFSGQVVLVGDCMGSVIGYDILSTSQRADSSPNGECYYKDSKKYASDTDLNDPQSSGNMKEMKAYQTDASSTPNCGSDKLPIEALWKGSAQSIARSPSTVTDISLQPFQTGNNGFDFEVTEFFMLGSPLALVLSNRIMEHGKDWFRCQKINSCQLYNLFYPTDPSAGRLEPLIDNNFAHIDTVKLPRYQRYPLGDGLSLSLFDCLQRHGLFTEGLNQQPLTREDSHVSDTSNTSIERSLVNAVTVARKWWGTKRLDYAIYCPEALHHFPANTLPHLFHGSFWESLDAVSFILRQILINASVCHLQPNENSLNFQPRQPREKWIHKRTGLKTKNMAPNHRANDVIVLEDRPQVINARFMYGSLDMVTLSDEKVDIHILSDQSTHQWVLLDTCTTDKYGRISYQVPKEAMLAQGHYPLKLVVRGDHTYIDLSMLVLPPSSSFVVFSIDGSFTASVSIMGKDPKVRPGAVDVVRYWQDLGYCILYISARPDMQLRKVVRWLALHNFPHGMVAFMDGVTAEPLRQKAQYLKNLMKETQIDVVAAYGSYKDITVYQSVNISPKKMYIVGKVNKKAYGQAQIINDGYAAHLQELQIGNQIAPSSGNARLYLQKSSFALHKKLSPTRSTSMPSGEKVPAISVTNSGNTVIDPGAEGSLSNSRKLRGRAPRLNPFRKPDDP